MDVDAGKVIDRLTQEISQHILQKVMLVVQIEELQEEIKKLKKEGD